MGRGALLLLLAFACRIVDRASSDYLRFTPGNVWVFLDAAGDTFRLLALVPQVAPEDSLSVTLDWEGRQEHFLERGDAYDRYVDFAEFPSGYVVPLETRIALYFEYPFVLGNTWSDSVTGHAVLLQDTVVYARTLEGSVLSLGSLDVNGRRYENAYEVSLLERYVSSRYDVRIRRLYWFAPDVGLVRARLGPDTFDFIDSVYVEEDLSLSLVRTEP